MNKTIKKHRKPRKRTNKKKKEPTQRQSQNQRIIINNLPNDKSSRAQVPVFHYSTPQQPIIQQLNPPQIQPAPTNNKVVMDEIDKLKEEFNKAKIDAGTNIEGIKRQMNSLRTPTTSQYTQSEETPLRANLFGFTKDDSTVKAQSVINEHISARPTPMATPPKMPDEYAEDEPIYTSGVKSLQHLKRDTNPPVRIFTTPRQVDKDKLPNELNIFMNPTPPKTAKPLYLEDKTT